MPSHFGPTFSLEKAWTGFSLYSHRFSAPPVYPNIYIYIDSSSQYFKQFNIKIWFVNYMFNMPRPLYVI